MKKNEGIIALCREGNRMEELTIRLKKAQGKRFKLFRQLVGKSPGEMAVELNKPPAHILSIENGEISPLPNDISVLYKGYGLNFTWLSFGKENIFYFKGEKTPLTAYLRGTLTQLAAPAELEEIIKKITGEPAKGRT